MRTYVRSRAWCDDAARRGFDRLTARGLVADDAFTDAGRAAREAVERATDAQMRPAIEALGDDADELITTLVGMEPRHPGRGWLPSRCRSVP